MYNWLNSSMASRSQALHEISIKLALEFSDFKRQKEGQSYKNLNDN